MAESKLAHGTEDANIVLFGKAGVGKSKLGNLILGKENHFPSSCAQASNTKQCSMGEVDIDGITFRVVDTPGFWDPNVKSDFKLELENCFIFLSPGFHVALYVVECGRFTSDDVGILQKFRTWFGNEIYKYLHVVFTHAEKLQENQETMNVENYLRTCDPELTEVITECFRRPSFVNSRGERLEYLEEVTRPIKEIIQRNSGNHYSSKEFMDIEAGLQKIDKAILDQIKEKEGKKLEEDIETTLQAELAALTDGTLQTEAFRETRRRQLNLSYQHELHKLARKETIRRFLMRRNRFTICSWVVGTTVGAILGGPGGAVFGAVVVPMAFSGYLQTRLDKNFKYYEGK